MKLVQGAWVRSLVGTRIPCAVGVAINKKVKTVFKRRSGVVETRDLAGCPLSPKHEPWFTPHTCSDHHLHPSPRLSLFRHRGSRLSNSGEETG